MIKMKMALLLCLLMVLGISNAADPYCQICELIERGGSYGDVIGVAPPEKNVTIFNGEQYLDYPVDFLLYTATGEENTSLRMKVRNIYGSSTEAFRLSIESKAPWFTPKEMEYSLEPDGFTSDGWPYWEVYPLGPNESIEISFVVDAIIGSANLINAKAQRLDRWSGNCTYPVSEGTNASYPGLDRHLFIMNHTGKNMAYHSWNDGNETVLLALTDSGFGVFRLNGSDISVVSDNATIEKIVDDYLDQNKPDETFNSSGVYGIMNISRNISMVAQQRCFVLTGMDRYNCTDRQSCFYSCFSVPVCSYIATGWEFIDTILEYRKTIDFADQEFNRSLDSSYAFMDEPGYDSAKSALADMVELNKAETAVVFHPIYTTYNYCPPADYMIPWQIEARRILMDYLESNCLYGERGELINQSLALSSVLKENANISVGINETNATASLPNITINETNATGTVKNQTEDEEGECLLGRSPVEGICWELMLTTVVILLIVGYILLNKKGKNY